MAAVIGQLGLREPIRPRPAWPPDHRHIELGFHSDRFGPGWVGAWAISIFGWLELDLDLFGGSGILIFGGSGILTFTWRRRCRGAIRDRLLVFVLN